MPPKHRRRNQEGWQGYITHAVSIKGYGYLQQQASKTNWKHFLAESSLYQQFYDCWWHAMLMSSDLWPFKMFARSYLICYHDLLQWIINLSIFSENWWLLAFLHLRYCTILHQIFMQGFNWDKGTKYGWVSVEHLGLQLRQVAFLQFNVSSISNPLNPEYSYVTTSRCWPLIGFHFAWCFSTGESHRTSKHWQ